MFSPPGTGNRARVRRVSRSVGIDVGQRQFPVSTDIKRLAMLVSCVALQYVKH